MKYQKTSLLKIGYFEEGPKDGQPILLLHGFPDDAQTWNEVTPALAAEGYHTYAPYQRGFGPTEFLEKEIIRSGQYTALAQDVIEFADALELERFTVVGHDWGAAAAYMLGALYPERLSGMVTLSVGYWGAESHKQQLSIDQIQAYWYQWHFQNEKGRETLDKKREEFCRRLWEVWAPDWKFSSATYKKTAGSFDNSDFVDVVIHSYRHRWRNAEGDPRYEFLETRLVEETKIRTPTILLHGAEDGASLAASSEGKECHFAKYYERRVLPGIGHFIPREDPLAVIDAVLELQKEVIASATV